MEGEEFVYRADVATQVKLPPVTIRLCPDRQKLKPKDYTPSYPVTWMFTGWGDDAWQPVTGDAISGSWEQGDFESEWIIGRDEIEAEE